MDDEVLWVKLSQRGGERPLLIGVAYAAPTGSGGCPTNIEEWYRRLEEDVLAARSLGGVVLGCDANARIGELPDYLPISTHGPDLWVEEGDIQAVRNPWLSCDKVCNSRGELHLNLCS